MSAPADLGPLSTPQLKALRPELFGDPVGVQVRRWAGRLLVLCLVGYALWRTDFSFIRIWEGLDKLGWLLGFMFPPSSGGFLHEFVQGLLETLAMAFLGTLLASLAALPLGFLGAKNVIPNWLFHVLIRRGFDAVRGVDQLILALIFVSAVGLGPFAGILAIAVADTGVLAKLFAEAIENVNEKPIEGVKAAGGNRAQVMRFAMLPQVFPVVLSNILYYFESNTRSATILGIVGAGGIGLHLAERIRVNNWDQVCFIIIMILLTVGIIDWVSKRLRLYLIGHAAYRP